MIIEKSKLANALGVVSAVTGGRTTLPVLASILFEAKGNELCLRGTDLDTTLEVRLEAAFDGDPAVLCLPARRVRDIAVELYGDNVEIDIEDNGAVIQTHESTQSYFRLAGFGEDDFPPFDRLSEGKEIALIQDDLKLMLQRVTYAVSSEEHRATLCGVSFEIKDEEVLLVATDGRRLASASSGPIQTPEENRGTFILPTKASLVLQKMLGNPDNNVTIKYDDKRAEFSFESRNGYFVTLAVKLIEGGFPDWKNVLPEDNDRKISIGRHEMLHAVKRASLMSADRVHLKLETDTLRIESQSPDVGSAKEKISIDYSGEGLEIAFNPVYLIEPMQVNREGTFLLEIKEKVNEDGYSNPAIIRFEGDRTMNVVMPLRAG